MNFKFRDTNAMMDELPEGHFIVTEIVTETIDGELVARDVTAPRTFTPDQEGAARLYARKKDRACWQAGGNCLHLVGGGEDSPLLDPEKRRATK